MSIKLISSSLVYRYFTQIYKHVLSVSLLSTTAFLYAQEGNIGINTEIPKATMEINIAPINENKDTNEGLLIPRLTKARVGSISDSNLKEGTLIYVEDENVSAINSNPKVAQITHNGFYHYNGTHWVKGVATDNNTTYTAGAGINISGVDNSIAVNPNEIALGGDVIGNANTNIVTKIQGKPVSNKGIRKMQLLQWNGEEWIPSNIIRPAMKGVECSKPSDIQRRWATDKGMLICAGNYQLFYYGYFVLAQEKDRNLDPGFLSMVQLVPNTDRDLILTLRLNSYIAITGSTTKLKCSSSSIYFNSNNGHGIGITNPEYYPETVDIHNEQFNSRLICNIDLRDESSAIDNGLKKVEYVGLAEIKWNYEITENDPSYN